MRVQRYVLANVTFVNAISRSVIWVVDERVTIGAAIHEISIRTGVKINQLKLRNDRGPVNFTEGIDEDVSVILVSE